MKGVQQETGWNLCSEGGGWGNAIGFEPWTDQRPLGVGWTCRGLRTEVS